MRKRRLAKRQQKRLVLRGSKLACHLGGEQLVDEAVSRPLPLAVAHADGPGAKHAPAFGHPAADSLALGLAQRDAGCENQNAARPGELCGTLLARSDAMAREQVAPGLQQALVVTAVGTEERRGRIAAQDHDGRRFGAGGQRASDAEDEEERAEEGRHGQSHSLGE